MNRSVRILRAGTKPSRRHGVTRSSGIPALLCAAAFFLLALPAPEATAQNNAPTARDSEVTADEDVAYAFMATDFNFADTDTMDTLDHVKIVTVIASGTGTLALNGTAVSANTTVTLAQLTAENLT